MSEENTISKDPPASGDHHKPEVREWTHTAHENDSKAMYGDNERNMVGYGATPVKPHWPRSAKVALNFVIHYEEGGEMCVLHGDDASESLLSDSGPNTQSYPNARNLNMESTYDYGPRCGFWRLHRLFTSRKVPVTVFGTGMALERNMEVVGAIKQQQDWEISCGGYRWKDYKDVPEEVEKEHIDRSVEIHNRLFGRPPSGLYTGNPSINTRKLAVNEGGFLYDSDAYNDDLPYWSFEHGEEGQPHLIIPYSMVENDAGFVSSNGWAQPDDFLKHLKRTLDFLVMEGRAGQPKMMSVGLHCRLSRPARAAVLAEFVDYAKSYGREVWITTRKSIANHWYENHLPRGCGSPITEGVAGAPSKSNGTGTSSGSSGYSGYFGYGSSSSSNKESPSKSSGGYGNYFGYGSSSSNNKKDTKKEEETHEESESDAAPPEPSVPPADKFSFLGNLKAPRDSVEYKESLKDKTPPKSDDESEEKEEEEPDVI